MMSNISLHFLLSHFFPFVFSLFLQQFLLFLYFLFFKGLFESQLSDAFYLATISPVPHCAN